jgi:murein DD-endopeptidase MepM/ murein hydrolase activator NlpD
VYPVYPKSGPKQNGGLLFLHPNIWRLATRTIAAICLIFLTESGAQAETKNKFFAIDRSDEAKFHPLQGAGVRQFLPGTQVRFFPIQPTDGRWHRIAHSPAKRTTDARTVPPPRLIRHIATTARHGDVAVPPAAPAMDIAPGPSPTRARHVWPVDTGVASRISSGYGWRRDPFTGEAAFHAGLDIAASAGSPVVATADGRVEAIGEHPRLGLYVMLIHEDGTVATYGHLNSITVSGGQAVRQGQPLGTLGSTGRSTGPHLDFGLDIDGRRVDPLPFLRPPPATTTTAAAGKGG